MYTAAFGLREEPFAPTPDPAFLYLTPAHQEALAAIEYGLRERRGFITLIGEVGTGKTTVLYSLLKNLSNELDTAFFTHTTLDFEDMLRMALHDLGIPTAPWITKRGLIAALDRHLHKQASRGRTTALVIDEAQNLSPQVLEELRLLSNFETFKHKLLQIVLVGQPEVDAALSRPNVRQLRERIAVRVTLGPLSEQQVYEYIAHRLRVAGGDGRELFTSGALVLVARLSGGIPRRVNALCHNALLCAYGRKLGRVNEHCVRTASAELFGAEPEVPGERRFRFDWSWLRWPRPRLAMILALVAALGAGVLLAIPAGRSLSEGGGGVSAIDRLLPADSYIAWWRQHRGDPGR